MHAIRICIAILLLYMSTFNNIIAYLISPIVHAVAPEVTARNDTMMPHPIILGEELRLGCGYVGVPGPTVQFFQNDSMLLMDSMNGVTIIGGAPSDNEITLEISSVGRMSGGTYTSRASNTVGMGEVVYSVTILGRYMQLPPSYVHVVSVLAWLLKRKDVCYVCTSNGLLRACV